MSISRGALLAAAVLCAVITNYAKADDCVLNDNYCDCGDDEPETNACSFYTSDTFLCKSKVYANQRIPLSRVDDGVCDCCDGSDESFPCKNTCAALETYRVEVVEKEANKKKAGIMAQEKLVDEAKQLYAAKLAEGTEAKEKTTALQAKVIDAKSVVSEATKAEYTESQLSVGDIATLTDDYKTRFAGVMSKESILDALLHGTLHGGQAILEALILQVEKSLKDTPAAIDTEKAIDAVTAFKNLQDTAVASDGAEVAPDGEFKTIADDLLIHLALASLDAATLSEIAFDIYERLFEDCEGNTLLPRGSEAKIAVDNACDVMRIFKSKKSERLAPQKELQVKLAAAREELSLLETELKGVKSKSIEYDDIMRKDFGPDNLLFLFYKKCFEMQLDKYYYSVCPFGTAKQDSSLLGKYDSLERRGDEIIIKFKYGDNCFATKRPRELSLSMRCGAEAKLVEITEPETCSYAAVLETPIAC
jgi:protein kinase C substrate 80K-H